ncbi:hypothetical protein QFZ25_000516 [Bacillus atrophaeus]|nr:radical SAM protein [Bacillus atrophaeus]MDQ0926456.1 hypothetical protein [Bacillus atrophaeus]
MISTNYDIEKIGKLKIELLANGISYDDDFIENYGSKSEYIEKRRAYGNSDESEFAAYIKVPQEVILPEGLVVAVNQRKYSKWSLSYNKNKFMITNGSEEIEVTFPIRPTFYDCKLDDGTRVSKLVTLYGNATLGIFSPGHCYYWNTGRECKFCSLQPTRNKQADHEMFIKPLKAKEAVKKALDKEGDRIEHILLNGGTISDYDLGFTKHLQVLEEISELELPNNIEKHLISMPPKDFSLFKRLNKTSSTIAMDMEIFNEKIFNDVCPGKSADYGRKNFFSAFDSAVEALGSGNVYCGFVAGLEPIESLIEGMYLLGEMGVVPAVNVFHNDPGSQFAHYPRPSYDDLLAIGHHMSIIYDKYKFKPFIKNTGRNSLDTEAYLKCYI